MNDLLVHFKKWKLIDQYLDTVVIDGTCIQLAGFACENDQGQILSGSAGGNQQVDQRAYFELIERLAVFEGQQNYVQFAIKNTRGKVIEQRKKEDIFLQSHHPEWRYALSSGVAFHQNFEMASHHAQKELLERDAVLASWYGLSMPKKAVITNQPFPQCYHLELYQFETLNDFVTTMTIARPIDGKSPLLYGFGCDRSLEAAEKKSTEELIQRIGFLYNEEREENMPFEPSALYLQEYYLNPKNHHRLDDWLMGKHFSGIKRSRQNAEIYFVELTPKEFTNACVLKAISQQTIPLIFGKGYEIEGVSIHAEHYLHPVV